jgi:hypothetical protein
MGGLFDLLRDNSDDQNSSTGTALDLLELPPNSRKIMRIMLRNGEVNYLKICEMLDQLPEAERMTRAEVDETLDQLTQNRWLSRIGEDQPVTYKVNSIRKLHSGHGTFTPRNRASIVPKGVWDALDFEPPKKNLKFTESEDNKDKHG